MRPFAAILLILCTGCASSRLRIPAGYVRDDCVIAAQNLIDDALSDTDGKRARVDAERAEEHLRQAIAAAKEAEQ